MTGPDRSSDPVALVTGAGSGIGRGAALALARSYGRVVVSDVDAESLERVHAEILDQDGVAAAITADVGQVDDVTKLVHAGLQAYGRIDTLVHCAGLLGDRTPVLEMPVEQWRGLLEVNLTGTFLVSREVGRHMAQRGHGTMILIASDRGLYGAKEKAHYAASKAGIIAFTKSLALELGSSGVTVNAINPGAVDTPGLRKTMTPTARRDSAQRDPLGQLSTPENIGEIVLFLAQTGGEFMTGQLITTRMRFG